MNALYQGEYCILALLVIKKMDGKYALGPTIASLYSAYQHQQSLEAIVVPILKKLMQATNESAAFHVRQGDKRGGQQVHARGL